MFPIRDHNPSGRVPYVTYGLIAVNILVFLGYWLTIRDVDSLNQFFFDWGLVPAKIMAGQGYSGLVTHMFLHGGWMHIGGNLLFLWIFGDNLEDVMGHLGYLVFYLACGFGAAALQIAGDPYSMGPMVGASGAIAGVLGGYLLLFPRARVDVLFIFVIFFKVFSIAAWIVLGLWFVVQFYNGVTATADGVAYLAHIGGYIAGLLLTIPVFLQRGGRAFWVQNAGHPPHAAAEYRVSPTNIPRVRRL